MCVLRWRTFPAKGGVEKHQPLTISGLSRTMRSRLLSTFQLLHGYSINSACSFSSSTVALRIGQHRYTTMVKINHKQAALDFLSFVNASPTRRCLCEAESWPWAYRDVLQLSMPSSRVRSYSQRLALSQLKYVFHFSTSCRKCKDIVHCLTISRKKIRGHQLSNLVGNIFSLAMDPRW